MEHNPPPSAREQALARENAGLLREREQLEEEIRRLRLDAKARGGHGFDAKAEARQGFFGRLLLDACPILLMFFDLDFRYVLGTRAPAAEWFGLGSGPNLAGASFAEVFRGALDGPWIEKTLAACRQALRSQAPLRYREEIPFLDGTRRVFDLSIHPASDAGVPQGFVMTLYDGAAPTHPTEAAMAKSSFLANMSHEIRTPLSAILGMCRLLDLTRLDNQQTNYVRSILTASDSLLSLINDILDFSEIDAQKFGLSPVSYSLAELTADVANIIGLRAAEKGLHFTVRADPQLPSRLIGDALRIKQVLIRLLSNAVKYTPKGAVSLHIGWERQGTMAHTVFQVEDTGIGIRQEALPGLFTAFAQLDPPNRRNAQGIGLGLALSKGIAEAMGGTITATSRYGEGSVFTLRIPQQIDSREPLARVESPGGKRLLLYGVGPPLSALEWMADRLIVPFDSVSTQEDFHTCVQRHGYTHFFYWHAHAGAAVRPELYRLHDTAVISIKSIASIMRREIEDEGILLLHEPLLIHDVSQTRF